jgi:glucosamine-6-phosphate deaminase
VEVVVLAGRDEVGRFAADVVELVVGRAAHPVLGLATGSSPLAAYDELVRRYREGGLSFAHSTTFLLDEYVGLPAGHPQRYRAVIEREFTGRIDIPPSNVHGLDGDAADYLQECAAYEDRIKAAGGIEIQLLGIGSTGHLAFNEPGSSLVSRTRLKTLTAHTRRDNSRFFGRQEEVPRHVLTQGLGTILAARHLLLVACGAEKAEPIRRAVEGPVTAMCPGSVLQLHPHVTVLLDEAAASGLAQAAHYRETWAGRPHPPGDPVPGQWPLHR